MTKQADLDKINHLLAKLMKADNRGNLEEVLQCFTDDIVWLPHTGKQVKGIGSISERYKDLYKNYDLDIAINPHSIKVSGDIAITYGLTKGSMTSKEDGTRIRVNDKYMMVIEQQDDNQWKISVLMWNKLTT